MKAGKQAQKSNAARAHDVRGKKAGKGKEHFVKGKNNEHLFEDNSEKSGLQIMHDKIQRKIYEADDVSHDSQSKKRTGTTAGYENPNNFEGEVKENCGTWKYSCATVNEDGSVNKDAGWVPLRFYKGPGSWAKYQRYLADQKLKKEVSDPFDGITGMSWANDMRFFLVKAEGEYGSITDFEITLRLHGGGDMLMGADVKTFESKIDEKTGLTTSENKYYYFGYKSQFDLGYIYSGLVQLGQSWLEAVKENPLILLASGPGAGRVGSKSWMKIGSSPNKMIKLSEPQKVPLKNKSGSFESSAYKARSQSYGGKSRSGKSGNLASNKTQISTSSILRSANVPYKGSTVLGNALSKHAGRNPHIWGKLTGAPSTWHAQAMKHFQQIVEAPGQFIPKTNAQGIKFLEKMLPDGRGIRLNMDGTFKGFID